MRRRMHGGHAKRGSEAPRFKHCRFSVVLSPELRAKFHAALADPRLLELRDDAALSDARIQWLLGQWTAGEENALTTLKRVRAAWDAMKAANATGTAAAITAAARALDAALDGAPLDADAIREELRREQQVKRRLVEQNCGAQSCCNR